MSQNNDERRKKIQEALAKRKVFQNNIYGNVMGKEIIRHADGSKTIVQKTKRQVVELARIPPSFKKNPETRPHPSLLTRIQGQVQKLPLPDGSFNGSILPINDKYLLVYRPTEYRFDAVYLDTNYNILEQTHKVLDLKGDVADPRLILTPQKKVIVSYSRFNMGSNNEYICGSTIVDLNISENIFEYEHYRISPSSIADRQKNWMPFICEDKIYFISDVHPHRIYEFDENTKNCFLAYETNYKHGWFNRHQLRGNTNCIKINDDYFMTIFHSVQKIGDCSYYDNGAYLFTAKPPFKIVKFGNKTIMPAEVANEKHFRKSGEIACVFPMSMYKESEQLVITYGDNDSAVKLLKTNLEEIFSTMIRV
jgi:predicted GH43/DUF377 family glycosyl hydrolase